MSVNIICTKQDGAMVTAQAAASKPLTWTLAVTPTGGGMVQTFPAPDNVLPNGTHTATWNNPPAGTYQVTASVANEQGMDDSEPVPFGNCT